MKLITITFLFLGLLIYSQNSAAQVIHQDVLYLKNGSVIKGIVVEVDDADSIGIKTTDGSLFVYKEEEVKTIQKEEVRATPTPQAMHYNHTGYKRKDPALAAIFSILLPGGGQYYNGQYMKGAVMTGVGLSSVALIVTGLMKMHDCYPTEFHRCSNESDVLIGIGATLLVCDYLWSVIDAPIVAGRINKMTRIQLGNNTTLSIKPDYSFNKEPLMNGRSTLTPTIGMKLSLSL